MNFLKRIDHLKMLKFALAISIFSIGYLITMFYFQMQDLKDFKQQIVNYNTASVNILHLESEIERDSYFTQSQILNHSVFSQQTNLDNKYIATFFEKTNFLNKIDTTVLNKNNEIKNLINNYKESKSKLFTISSGENLTEFNSAVYDLVGGIHNYSNYLESKIEIYNQNYDEMINNSKISGFLTGIFSLVIFVLAYLKMNGDIEKLKKINDEILFINQTLNNAEMVAGFGSWKINTVDKKFIFSDNFYRLVGVEPKAFEPSLEKIIEYIHPDDREQVLKVHRDSFVTQEPTTVMYRYLLPDGSIKHIITVGKFLHNSKGDLVKIGVNQDITGLMVKSKALEENNTKLVAINAELESFNNIVSHDLQEPLRKIQMFISRIENKEFLENSSETTVSYFGKIKSAAQRMQNLMTDLVNYTRTVKGDRIFEQVDLNEIFEEITDELSLIIEEKQAKIKIDQLPTILGTRFQIQQLFINLVSNSLKYVKPNVAPIIDIRLENFDTEIVNEKRISNTNYYKITVSDNGIGFEQKHADKIFLLFKRLETDETYKGTGLGLAICKKIIDNNNGLITAIGIPGDGSVFTVYLPKNTNFN